MEQFFCTNPYPQTSKNGTCLLISWHTVETGFQECVASRLCPMCRAPTPTVDPSAALFAHKQHRLTTDDTLQPILIPLIHSSQLVPPSPHLHLFRNRTSADYCNAVQLINASTYRPIGTQNTEKHHTSFAVCLFLVANGALFVQQKHDTSFAVCLFPVANGALLVQ